MQNEFIGINGKGIPVAIFQESNCINKPLIAGSGNPILLSKAPDSIKVTSTVSKAHYDFFIYPDPKELTIFLILNSFCEENRQNGPKDPDFYAELFVRSCISYYQRLNQLPSRLFVSWAYPESINGRVFFPLFDSYQRSGQFSESESIKRAVYETWTGSLATNLGFTDIEYESVIIEQIPDGKKQVCLVLRKPIST